MALLGGRYEIICELGRGGMAEVLLALDRGPAGVQRLVVIKRILPALAADEKFVSMFLNEARIASNLSHPNIAHIYEVGVAGGEYFLAMEFIHGVDLLALLRTVKRALRPAHAAHVASRVAAALHHAHNLRNLEDQPLAVVHRDISPQNIRISHEGIVKVLDFGIARAGTDPKTDTQRNIVKGKFSYMSPEQVRSEEVDGRSDLFSLGVVLFEMLTYCRLFKRETPAKTLQAVLRARIPRPSEVVDRPIPEALDRIVARLLERDRDARYGWAREVEADLEAYLRTDPSPTADLEALLREHFGPPQSMRALMDRVIAGEEVEELTTETPSDSMETVSERIRLLDQALSMTKPGVTDSGAIVILDGPVEETEEAHRQAPGPVLTPLAEGGEGDQHSALPDEEGELQLESGVFRAIQEEVIQGGGPRSTAELPSIPFPRRRVQVRPVRSGRAGLWLVLVLLAAAVGGGVWWWKQRGPEAARPQAQAPARLVQIRFEVEPPGAEVSVDGVRLTSPSLELPASDREYAVEVRAPGHGVGRLTFRPLDDRTVRVVLPLGK